MLAGGLFVCQNYRVNYSLGSYVPPCLGGSVRCVLGGRRVCTYRFAGRNCILLLQVILHLNGFVD